MKIEVKVATCNKHRSQQNSIKLTGDRFVGRPVVLFTVMMMTPGDVRDVSVERPLLRRGLHREEVDLPHPHLIQPHSQDVSSDTHKTWI